jgi:FkbM family methyltransferase
MQRSGSNFTTYVLTAVIAIGLVGTVVLLYKPPKAESLYKNSKLDVVTRTAKPQNAKPMLEIPDGIKTVWINVGTHTDPLLPPDNDKSVMVIGFEPNLELIRRITPHERVYIVPAAVGNFEGVAAFHLSNNDGSSSSLAQFHDHAAKLNSGKSSYVPVVRLDSILQQIPDHIKVDKIKIDAQGFDLEVIKSAGSQLHRFKSIIGEVVVNEDLAYYKDVDNSRKSWLAFMGKNGYKKVAEECNGVSEEQLKSGVRCEEGNLEFEKT